MASCVTMMEGEKMYIWIACDLSGPLAFFRDACRDYNRSLQLSEVAFSLPQHVSLKISFEVADVVTEEVIEAVSDYLSGVSPFEVTEAVPELCGSVLWLRFPENESLKRLHRELDEMLWERYGVPQHEFDRDFKFHSTLFIDEDIAALGRMYEMILSLDLPKRIKVNGFLIGVSNTGKAGEYSVYKKIAAKCK